MNFSLKGRLKIQPLIISLAVVIMGVYVYFPTGNSFLNLIEYKTIDLRYLTRGKIDPKPQVALVVIDENSIDEEGRWPWPRSKVAELIDKMSEGGASVVGFDIGFVDPDDKTTVKAIEKIKKRADSLKLDNSRLNKYMKELSIEADNDLVLSRAIKNSKAKIVLGYFFQMEEEDVEHVSKKQKEIQRKNIKESEITLISYSSEEAMKAPIKEAVLPESNITLISNSSPYSGYFNMEPEADGVIRRLTSMIKYEDSFYAPLSLMILSAYFDAPLSVEMEDHGVEILKLGEQVIPADEKGRIMINYRWKEKIIPHISATNILNDKIPENSLKDKILLVGATAVGIYDLRVTPFQNDFPGLEIHGQVVDSILAQEYLYFPAWIKAVDILIIIILGLLTGIILTAAGATSGAIGTIVMFVGHILLCQFLFNDYGIIVSAVYPLLVLIITYVSIVGYKYFAEESKKRFITDAFSTYLAPSVVKGLIESPESLELGGEQKNITAFFSDVQGFTSISENLTPKELVELLNEFLTAMTDIILGYEGTVDKFEGDAIIAFFGAPNTMENHAEVACRASIDMQKKLASMRSKWKLEGRPELKMRIGLYSGNAVVGNMGSVNRMDYTMMGDTVNIAARLEGVNKVYGTYSMAGESTLESVGDDIFTRQIDHVAVVGRAEPVAIYQLLGLNEEIDSKTKSAMDLYLEGVKCYRDQQWSKARKIFNDVLEIIPDDSPSVTMIKRCDEYEITPPVEDWDGSFSMTSK